MKRVALLCIAVALVLSQLASAGVPETTSYQGVLRNDAGDLVPDGTYEFVFELYETESGGSVLWSEVQVLTTTQGVFNALLGSNVPLDLAFDVPYWLDITVDGSHLDPRTPLATAPYAFRATVAESLAGGSGASDGDWTVVGDDMYPSISGNVGIGTTTPEYELDVRGTARVDSVLRTSLIWTVDTTDDLNFIAGGGYGMRFTGDTGRLGIGTGSPQERLDVFGTARMNGFTMPTGAADGYVLTSDASGAGTWQPSSSGGVGGGGTADYVAKFVDATTLGNSAIVSDADGDVGIGTESPGSRLSIREDGTSNALNIYHTDASANRTVNIERSVAPDSDRDMLQIKVPSGSPDDFQFIECERGTQDPFVVDGDGHVTAEGGATITGATAGDTTAALYVEYTGPAGTLDPYAIVAICDNEPFGIGGYFRGDDGGVEGWVYGQGPGSSVFATAGRAMGFGHEGTLIGVYGGASGGEYNYSIYGSGGSGADNDWAGYFSGDVRITGDLNPAKGGFEIDHPVDPSGKYLRHSFVESDERANVYSGNVALDGAGDAWVELPDWLEALNRDFRYQLTAIGAPGPNLYIADRISGGRFRIAGGEPGMEVSWQVTGVRSDPYAAANPLAVEREKTRDAVGRYLHPEVYGGVRSDAIGYVEPKDPETPRPSRGDARRRDREE